MFFSWAQWYRVCTVKLYRNGPLRLAFLSTWLKLSCLSPLTRLIINSHRSSITLGTSLSRKSVQAILSRKFEFLEIIFWDFLYKAFKSCTL
ncbi:hypothetical protein BKA67DRAFT_545309 [Truncatella angustata]|uniref:Uncharacterized protein n=1 Tax=Truncatella angustata TaxID=152316 RepID=A0A9P8UUZ0_9PEZI|nr:uncharacterized protein BKA67DRAFT_545309 [Truncatella angustata]KAH6659664.1 hypothetical protein BKA67DRAFT_545309 [Truncatella angustata]